MLSCHGHVDELATEPFLLLHHEHGTGYRRSWNCCDRWTRFVVIWKHFCFILSTRTKIRIDSVMRPRSSSRGRNTSASVTVTVCRCKLLFCIVRNEIIILCVLYGSMVLYDRRWQSVTCCQCTGFSYLSFSALESPFRRSSCTFSCMTAAVTKPSGALDLMHWLTWAMPCCCQCSVDHRPLACAAICFFFTRVSSSYD